MYARDTSGYRSARVSNLNYLSNDKVSYVVLSVYAGVLLYVGVDSLSIASNLMFIYTTVKMSVDCFMMYVSFSAIDFEL